jgi:hypothetical protein
MATAVDVYGCKKQPGCYLQMLFLVKKSGCAAHIGMDIIRIEKEPRQETSM